jgi:hypothetical protein
VDELAGTGALVALRGSQAEPAEPAHPDPGQDRRDRRDRHLEQLGDLGTGKPQPTQRGDHLDTALRRAIRDPLTRRAAVQQPGL